VIHTIQPLDIIWGKDDRILNESLRKKCMGLLLNCKHEEIEGCGHLPHIDKPQLIANRIHTISRNIYR